MNIDDCSQETYRPQVDQEDYDTMMDMINHYKGENVMDSFVEKVNQLNQEIEGYINTISEAQDVLASAENELNALLDEHAHEE